HAEKPRGRRTVAGCVIGRGIVPRRIVPGRIVPGHVVSAHIVTSDVMAAQVVLAAQAEQRNQELTNDQGAAEYGTDQVYRFHRRPRLEDASVYPVIRARIGKI